MYISLKLIHVGAAVLTVAGFTLRGYWMLVGSPRLEQRIVRIAPHIVDTVFLLSGISLVWVLKLPILDLPWLIAKLAALVVYIILGMIALRHGNSLRTRRSAFLLALATFTYIAGVAISKSMGSWFALL